MCEIERIYEQSWGAVGDAKRIPQGKWSAIAFGPNSEAIAVLVRPRGRANDPNNNFMVTARNPWMGPPIGGQGDIVPLLPFNASDADLEHSLELLLYSTPPPVLPTRRANAYFTAGVSLTAITSSLATWTRRNSSVTTTMLPLYGRTGATVQIIKTDSGQAMNFKLTAALVHPDVAIDDEGVGDNWETIFSVAAFNKGDDNAFDTYMFEPRHHVGALSWALNIADAGEQVYAVACLTDEL